MLTRETSNHKPCFTEEVAGGAEGTQVLKLNLGNVFDSTVLLQYFFVF